MHPALAGELTLSPADRPTRVERHHLTVRIGKPDSSPTANQLSDLEARLGHLQPRVSQVGEAEWDVALTVLADSDAAARDYVTRMLSAHGRGWLSSWRFTTE